jgi:FimV-like protein
MNAMAMHTTKCRARCVSQSILWLWLCLMSLSAHALTLGDLAVPSTAAPHFSASFPFSDDRPVKLSEMQARVATRGEYARLGFPMSSVVRELRVRVVPASATVGYVELYSPSQLSQNHFDLLIWSSYFGQTTLTHYRVALNEMPFLIKGKVLSSTSAQSPTPRSEVAATAVEKTKKNPRSKKTLSPTVAIDSDAVTPSETESAEDPANIITPAIEQANPTPLAAAVNGSTNEARMASDTSSTASHVSPPLMEALPATTFTQTQGQFNTVGMLLVASLVLFLVGFFAGRLRSGLRIPRTAAKPTSIDSLEPTKRDLAHPAPPPNQSHDADFYSAAPAMHFAQQASSEQGGIHGSTHEILLPPVMPTHVAPHAAFSSKAVTRASASALPTPGFDNRSGRNKKTGHTKSAGNANIDLAKIYLSMGDPSTALMMLRQVAEQGSDAEKAAAKQLINGIT